MHFLFFSSLCRNGKNLQRNFVLVSLADWCECATYSPNSKYVCSPHTDWNSTSCFIFWGFCSATIRYCSLQPATAFLFLFYVLRYLFYLFTPILCVNELKFCEYWEFSNWLCSTFAWFFISFVEFLIELMRR